MVIPKGWEIRKVESITNNVVAGGTPSTKQSAYWNGSIPWMNSGELNKKRVYSVDGRITELGLNNSSTNIVPSKCVLIGLAGQGKTRGTVAVNYFPLCTNQSIAAIFPNPEEYETEFLYQNLDMRYEELRELSTGDGGRGGLNLKLIRNLDVLLPSLPEQKEIAAILSDADSYISVMERLIAKKRDIKQGAMQELLRPKDGWENRTLGDVLTISHGQSQKKIKEPTGKYPILATSGEIGRTNIALYDKPSVLIGRKGTIDRPQYMDEPFWTIDTLFYTIIKAEYSPKYLYYLFCTIDWAKYNEASGVPSLSARTIESIEIKIPKFPEQTRIAAILSDMDAEINALVAKLNKAKLIKRGMMEQLLTGKIRLEGTGKKSVTKVDEKEKQFYNEGYTDAVILVALVKAFGTEDYPFTAFDCQKFPYLFHRHVGGNAKGYKKFKAGPYNPSLKYKTARPIALGKKYIREHTGKYKGFVVAENADEALGYFAKWYGNEPLKWLEHFRYLPKRKDELELLTTTDKAMEELRGENKPVTTQAVKDIIKKSSAWKDKLKRPIFSDANITRAIKWSNELFGKEVTGNA